MMEDHIALANRISESWCDESFAWSAHVARLERGLELRLGAQL
jgi:hypothetical protein